MMSNMPLRIDEIKGRPIFVVEGTPYRMVAVDRDGVVDPHVLRRLANVIGVFLEFELGRMHAYHHQSLGLVLLGPRADIGKRASPIDAGIGPEVDEDDSSPQAGCRQWRRIEPFGRTVERGQRAFVGQSNRWGRHLLDHAVILSQGLDRSRNGAGERRCEQEMVGFHGASHRVCVAAFRAIQVGCRSIIIDFDDGLGKGQRGLLRKIVSDAALDSPVRILAREFPGIGTGVRMRRDGSDANGRDHTQPQRAFDLDRGAKATGASGTQQALASDADSAPNTGMLPSEWKVSQATPWGSVTQYLSDLA